MSANPSRLRRISHIMLNVRNVEQSAAFYRDVFGMEVAEKPVLPGIARHCFIRDPDGACGFGLIVRQGHPAGIGPRGVDHFTFEVPAVPDVLNCYRRARDAGAQATEPRMYDGHWQTFIFDPDGYKVEVLTRTHHEGDMSRAAGRTGGDQA